MKRRRLGKGLKGLLTIGVLGATLGVPLFAKASHTQWMCAFDFDANTRLQSQFFFFSGPGLNDDNVGVSGKGRCLPGAGSHGGPADFGGTSYPATLSGFRQGGQLIFGRCDADRGDFRALFVASLNVQVRVQPPGRPAETFSLRAAWNEIGPPLVYPFPGPLPHVGTLRQGGTLVGEIHMSTRIGNQCPPAGMYDARYTLHFTQFELF